MTRENVNNDHNVIIWLHYARPRPHWYALDPKQKTDLETAWSYVRDKALTDGYECLGTFHIRGQHDFETAEIWKFPNAECIFQFWQTLVAARYSEFFAFSNNIGLEQLEKDI